MILPIVIPCLLGVALGVVLFLAAETLREMFEAKRTSRIEARGAALARGAPHEK